MEKLIIHCPTQEDYEKIECKLTKDFRTTYDYGEETCLRIENGIIVNYGRMDTYKSNREYSDYQFTTAKEYLGEVPKETLYNEEFPPRWYGEGIREYINAMQNTTCTYKDLVGSGVWVHKDNNLTDESIVKKTMSSVVKFAKDLTLTADEKALRKAGLKDEEGYYTESAERIVADLEAKERGYKNEYELSRATGFGDEEINLSAFELESLYKKFEKNILEVAKNYNEENKKK